MVAIALLQSDCGRDESSQSSSRSLSPPSLSSADSSGGSSPPGSFSTSSTSSGAGRSEAGAAVSEPEPTGPPAVQFIGRFDTRDAKGPKCAWPGCRILARFEGNTLSVRLNEIVETWMEGAPSEWDVSVDGQLGAKIVATAGVEKDYPISAAALSGTSPGSKHVVELFKRSEAQNGVTQFISFDFGPGGRLLAPRPRSQADRRIEIIGDSAVAGFGVEGVGLGPDCPNADWGAMWQNFHKSLGVRLAEDLNAELFGTVYSGKGVSKNIWHPNTETMPIIFSRSNPLDVDSVWDFTAYVPNVVLVMLGGNDFAVGKPVDEGPATLTDFTNAYDSFVMMIRSKYKDAHIFLITSPSVSDEEPPGRYSRTNVKAGIATVVQRRTSAGDTKVYSIEPPVAQPTELTGCNGHGNPEFHQRVANDLRAVVKLKTGW
jgi:hypothetical protein